MTRFLFTNEIKEKNLHKICSNKIWWLHL